MARLRKKSEIFGYGVRSAGNEEADLVTPQFYIF